MPKRRFALERGGKKVLEVRWRQWRGLRDFEVSVEGAGTWRLEPAAVRAGATVTLPGGSTLLVQYVKRGFWSTARRDKLRLERDGVPVPGSDGDPRLIARGGGWLMILLGLLRFLYAFFDQKVGGPVFDHPGVAMVGLSGLALLVLGVAAVFGRRTPLLLGAAVLGLEVLTIVGLRRYVEAGGVIMPVLVAVHLARAWHRTRPRAATPTLGAIFE